MTEARNWYTLETSKVSRIIVYPIRKQDEEWQARIYGLKKIKDENGNYKPRRGKLGGLYCEQSRS
jgi:hypothetical protein